MEKELSKQLTFSLNEAVREIKSLRAQNQIMSARLDMFDSMMLVFTSSPAYRGGGMSPDIVYDLEKQVRYLEELQKEEMQSKH